MRHIVIMALFAALAAPAAGQSKKVYCDYHGVRRTRAHDGDFGVWKYNATFTGPTHGATTLTSNPDVILPDGRHWIAAAHYPLVGMQSQLDPAYLEYEILSARAAGIDGFFIEWGYRDHESNLLLRTMQPIAARHGFEIGINWCDAWLMRMDGVTRVRPDVATREQRLAYACEGMQYLIDSVFTGPTAPRVNGKPVFYLFGGNGMTREEVEGLKAYPYRYNADVCDFPTILYRVAPIGDYADGVYTPASFTAEFAGWERTAVPAMWIPERRVPAGPGTPYPDFDWYARPADVAKYLDRYRTEILDPGGYPLLCGFVTPGMDNRACAGWNRNAPKYSRIDRRGGDHFREMWQFCVEHRARIDLVFIASWSDYTEGHEIEPTVEHGDRELRTVQAYSARFRGARPGDPELLELPLELFRLRQRAGLLRRCGAAVQAYGAALDRIARDIGRGNRAKAVAALERVTADFARMEERFERDTIRLDAGAAVVDAGDNPYDDGTGVYSLASSRRFYVGLPPRVREQLAAARHYEGYLCFEYRDAAAGDMNILCKTDREPAAKFKYLAQIRMAGTGAWIPARIEIRKGTARLDGTESTARKTDFSIYGNTELRHISLEFAAWK